MKGAYLSGIFAYSPIGPLQKHMSEVLECVKELKPFVEASIAGDTEKRDRHHQRIIELEQQADKLNKKLRRHLPTSLFMPIDRRDMLEILAMQEKLADAVRDVAGIISGRNMQIPEVMATPYLELVITCITACERAHEAVRELDELIVTGFDNSERKRISSILTEVDNIEGETDRQSAALADVLMGLEADYPAVHVMFLYRVLDRTSAIADRAERIGGRLQLILAR
jgi:predicted phosphate transport protein (TIGR00153 family)